MAWIRILWYATLILQALASGGVARAAWSPPKALVVDYEMNPPVVISRLLDDLKLAGFQPAYRPFYPHITRKDLKESALLVVLSGDGPGYPGPGMSVHALRPLEDFVRSGGALVLGPLSGGAADEGGDQERYLFNLLLHRLGIGIRIQDDRATGEGESFRGPLYELPLATAAPWLPWVTHPGKRVVTDRSPSLKILGGGAEVLLRANPGSSQGAGPSWSAGIPLVAVGRAGGGVVAVAGRYLLTWGGGNAKEPTAPLLPLAEEENALRDFLRGLFAAMRDGQGLRGEPSLGGEAMPAPVEPPGLRMHGDPLPEKPPDGVEEVCVWRPGSDPASAILDPRYEWIRGQGVRAGWSYIDGDPYEVARLIREMDRNGLNLLWGVAHPQLLLSPKGTEDARANLVSRWEEVAARLAGSRVRWFVGMEYPGRYSTEKEMTRAIGAEGRAWPIPSPWDMEAWRKQVVKPALLLAQWSTSHPEVAGIILDLEMYGRRPLFFSQGVDYGDGPFLSFLKGVEEKVTEQGRRLPPGERFSWLREGGLLRDYLLFMERRSEEMGRELRDAIRAIHPHLILGCYSAGILHRWFYRGLWRGMSEPKRPILLFTFQRDADTDLAQLRAEGVHALHVRGLLMGMMNREDYVELFRDSLARHAGYWLNRVTSLVAKTGFYPIESPRGMRAEEAWEAIRQANQETLVSPKWR